MCDYSLQNVKSRPARVGDQLRTRDFFAGTRGFSAPEDANTAVCVLPGTELAFAKAVMSAARLTRLESAYRQSHDSHLSANQQAKSRALRAYQRRTLVADALIAGTCLAGTNTRRVRRALGALFNGASPQPTV